MKLSKPSSALIALTVIAFAIVTLSAQRLPNRKATADWTYYYWFDGSNNFVWRQNFIEDESNQTGFDPSWFSPMTLQEKGFSPSAVYGDPPTPINPWLPQARLYSHP